MDGSGDAFASITEICHVSASQEDLLRHCPFACESDDDEQRVESTGIFMVSPPESSTSHDVFQTPLESSEEQWLMAVELPDYRSVDASGTDGVETVDLGKDSDLGFSEGLADSPSKKPKLSEQNMASEAPAACVTDTNTENFDVRLDSESRQNLEISEEETAVEANGDDVKVSEESSAKRKLKFFQLEFEESSEHDLEGEIANASERYCVRRRTVEKGAESVEITVLDVLKILKEGCDGDEEDERLKNVSILEICKQRGVSFPRPTWWPEDGFEVVDDRDDGGGGGWDDGSG